MHQHKLVWLRKKRAALLDEWMFYKEKRIHIIVEIMDLDEKIDREREKARAI